jgi:hypothetical protein
MSVFWFVNDWPTQLKLCQWMVWMIFSIEICEISISRFLQKVKQFENGNPIHSGFQNVSWSKFERNQPKSSILKVISIEHFVIVTLERDRCLHLRHRAGVVHQLDVLNFAFPSTQTEWRTASDMIQSCQSLLWMTHIVPIFVSPFWLPRQCFFVSDDCPDEVTSSRDSDLEWNDPHLSLKWTDSWDFHTPGSSVWGLMR